jgi:CubicO group peptidase (beta-lactamase class C family)
MEHSGIQLDQYEQLKNKARGYENDKFKKGDPMLLEGYVAAGTLLYATAEDLFKWDRALYQEQLADKASINQIFTDHTAHLKQKSNKITAFGYGWGYGYGWVLDPIDHAISWHNGLIGYFNSMIYRDTRRDTVIIQLSNLGENSVIDPFLLTGPVSMLK